MRPCSAALAAFLHGANYEAVQIDLYTFALATGEVFRFTSGNAPLTVPAAGFPSGSINAGADRLFALGPRFGRSKLTTKIGVQPAEIEIDVFAGSGDLVGTTAFAEAVRVGLFDGAAVELDRFFAPPQAAGSGPLDTSLGVLLWFYGHVAECEAGRSRIAIRVKSLMNLLAVQQMPRRLYQASCNHVFGDTMCGYDRVLGRNAAGVSTEIGAVTIAALAGSTQAEIATSFSPDPATAYDEGTIIAVSGANSGATRTITRLTGGIVRLLKPWLSPVTVGDMFQLLPGCDHTTQTCRTVLQNIARYGGFPYVPPPESAA
jgi:uncharacterized phage protein (TIGR02218 family)